jgi:hypothetical protein
MVFFFFFLLHMAFCILRMVSGGSVRVIQLVFAIIVVLAPLVAVGLVLEFSAAARRHVPGVRSVVRPFVP